MTFHHLWNLTQFLHYIVEFLRILQVKSDESAGLIAYFLRVNIKLATFEYADVGQFLYALMNSGTTHIACASHFKERNSCVRNNEFEYFLV